MKNIILFFTTIILLASCTKEVDALPEATETGANTFGARVNGEFWIPQGFGIVPTAPILEARFGLDNRIIINARNFASSPTESEFEIYLHNVIEPGIYHLNSTTGKYPNQSANYAYYVERRMTPTDEWITNNQFTGTINVTRIDRIEKIISGTFEFRGNNLYGTKELTVTDGRFDVKIL